MVEENRKELNDIRQELLNRPDQYITFRDLVERFDEVDAEFNHSSWNLLQIYSNFNILIGTEREDKQMNKLEKAKEIVKEHYEDACCGIFDSRNIVGDIMSTIYEDEELTIDICYGWAYFEVFGLSDAEFEELEKYYCSLKETKDEQN